jgi:hypothetical protein
LSVTGLDYLAATEFQLTHLWDFYLIDNPPTGAGDVVNFLVNRLPSQVLDMAAMMFRVTETTLMFPGLETETTKAGFKIYKERVHVEEFSVKILEDITFSSLNYFQTWMDQVYDQETALWFDNPPMKTGILTFYSPVFLPSAVFTLKNVKIKKITDIPLNREGGSPLTLSVNLTFDKLETITLGSTVNKVVNAAKSLIKI